jgi:chromosome segregation ATPase
MWPERRPNAARTRMRKFAMPEKIRPVEQMLELSEEAISPEHLDSQVQKAQDQLLQLKRQQEQIEKQKRELEELSRRQEELERGRAEMSDKLARSLVVLEREAYDTQKKLEQLRTTRESFGQHLELVEAIDPKSWNPTDLHKELSRALSTVEDARTEFSQQRSRLQAADENSNDVALPETASDVAHLLNGSRSFGQWAKIGFAFSLPLMIFAFIAFLLIFWLTSKGL